MKYVLKQDFGDKLSFFFTDGEGVIVDLGAALVKIV